ncbi:hypothetical protein TMP248_140024 [Tenacibaculum maritimum]|uniref:hypothetical protein n=1 Tax=Tenacibaculum maritimum TaxID=107401 RepID=UPI0012E55AB8|nr:hypothetical protein [Tenacibaculum maritimum]CAA0172533.1 hypothetical protein TMP248_140024 [Tenacibaculum maritimum]
MKKTLIIILVFFVSCNVTKDIAKKKTDRILKEQTETKTYRKGDTVHYKVPNVVFKDTTIIRKNYITGTTLRQRYNVNGKLEMLECISGAIEEITKSNRELVEAIKQKDKQKTKEFQSEIIIYPLIALIVMLFLYGVFLVKYIDKKISAFIPK